MKKLKVDLKNGLSKMKTFENEKERGGNLVKASRYLANKPDLAESEKYYTANNVLIFIYGLLVAINIVGVIPALLSMEISSVVIILSIGLAIPGFVIYLLYKQLAASYIVIVVLLFRGISSSLEYIEVDLVGTLLGIGINSALICLALFLKIKLFPFQNILNLRKDKNGYFIFTSI